MCEVLLSNPFVHIKTFCTNFATYLIYFIQQPNQGTELSNSSVYSLYDMNLVANTGLGPGLPVSYRHVTSHNRVEMKIGQKRKRHT